MRTGQTLITLHRETVPPKQLPTFNGSLTQILTQGYFASISKQINLEESQTNVGMARDFLVQEVSMAHKSKITHSISVVRLASRQISTVNAV